MKQRCSQDFLPITIVTMFSILDALRGHGYAPGNSFKDFWESFPWQVPNQNYLDLFWISALQCSLNNLISKPFGIIRNWSLKLFGLRKTTDYNFFKKYLPVFFLNISAYLNQYGPGPIVLIFSWHAFRFTKPDVRKLSDEWNPFVRISFIYTLKRRNSNFSETKRGLAHLRPTLSSYRNQSIDIWCNSMTSFNMMGKEGHCVKYAWMRVFADPFFPYKDRSSPYTGRWRSVITRFLAYFTQWGLEELFF